jgi:hypothetical protein
VVLSNSRALRRPRLSLPRRSALASPSSSFARPVTVRRLFSAAPRRAPWTRRGAAASPRRARSAPPPQPPPRRTTATSGTTPPPPCWCASGTGDSASRAARPGAPPPAQPWCTGIGSAARDTPRREPRSSRPRPAPPPRRAPDRWEALRAKGTAGRVREGRGEMDGGNLARRRGVGEARARKQGTGRAYRRRRRIPQPRRSSWAVRPSWCPTRAWTVARRALPSGARAMKSLRVTG